MTFIEGIGDEVTAFFVIVIVIILATLVTFISSGPHVYTPVHTRAVQFSFISGRELAEASFVQSPDPPDSSTSNDNQNQASSNDPSQQPPTSDQQTTSTNQDQDGNQTQTLSSSLNLQSSNQHAQDQLTHQQSNFGCDRNEQESLTEHDCSHNEEQSLQRESVGRTVGGSARTASVEEDARTVTEDGIRVRLKYLDDTERTVRSSPVIRVGDFKRSHFPEDLAANKIVRLIFCGHLLRDASTLASYRVVDNSVLHVQVLQRGSANGSRPAGHQNSPAEMLDLSQLLYPLVILILGLSWAAYVKYPEFFSLMSVSILFVFTGAFFAFYRHVNQ